MKRVFSIPGYNAEKAEKYLFISGIKIVNKKIRKEYWGERIIEAIFELDVKKEDRPKLERIKDFIPFKSSRSLEKFLQEQFPPGDILVNRERGCGIVMYIYHNKRINRIEVSDALKYLTLERLRERLETVGIILGGVDETGV